jgi:tetratricopeptide (TPR) repeat protein
MVNRWPGRLAPLRPTSSRPVGVVATLALALFLVVTTGDLQVVALQSPSLQQSSPLSVTTLGLVPAFTFHLLGLFMVSTTPAMADSQFEGKTTEELLELSKRLLAQGQRQEAVQALDVAISRDASDYMTVFRRAAITLSMGRLTSALADLDAVLAAKPDFDQALLQRGKLLLKMCALDRAKGDFKTLKGHRELSEELRQEADQGLTQAMEAATWVQTALAIMERTEKKDKSEVETALEALNHALTVCSQDVDLRMHRARAFEELGDYAQAIGDYTWVN